MLGRLTPHKEALPYSVNTGNPRVANVPGYNSWNKPAAASIRHTMAGVTLGLGMEDGRRLAPETLDGTGDLKAVNDHGSCN